MTLKDVAAKVGVSPMTVSLALDPSKRNDRMTAETRDRVLLAARELGYRPNQRARALRTGRTKIIGLYAGHGYINVRVPFFTEIVSGLQEGCEQTRKDLLLHGLFHGSNPENICQELVDGRIDGLIINLASSSPLARMLAQSKFSVIAIADPVEGIPSVTVDDADGSRQIVEHLFQRGHRKVIYSGRDDSQIVSAERRRISFLKHADSVGISVNTRVYSEEGDLAEFARNTLNDKVTAVVFWTDQPALELLSICPKLGIRVPQDLAIVGFNDVSVRAEDEIPFLTSVKAPCAELARVATHHLDTLLKGESVAPETILPVSLTFGRST